MKSPVALVFALFFISGAYASFLADWLGFWTICGVGLGLSLIIPSIWRLGPKRWVYLLATIVALLSFFYVKMRSPQPEMSDVSKYAPLSNVVVRGEVIDAPSLTRSERAKFLLAVKQINTSGKTNIKATAENLPVSNPTSANQESPDFINISGKLYVTLPLIKVTGLRSGQMVELSGRLYLPSRADNFGAFDFKAFLARQGVFAGLSGRSIVMQGDPPSFGEWWFVSRIVRAHVMGAGVPEGSLLSSLVLGSRAVDLPSSVKDEFIEAGLAAVLAASGFQVTLVLGAAIALSRGGNLKQQFALGSLSLLGYLLLTGASPSILRAVIMGMGSLIGLVVQRRSRPVVGLLVTAVLLLIYQPLWIWDLGFQFSFLATFGLITSSRAITQRLQWLPPAIADLMSVPIAAYIWTLPLQLLMFGKITPYSLLANVFTTPLVAVSTYGGIISGILGIIFIPLGAAIAWLLYPFLHWIVFIAQWINTLPKANTSVGAIALWQMFVAYGLFLAIWLVPWFSKMQRWTIAFTLACLVLFVPNAIAQTSTFQVTLPAFNEVPIMLIQSQSQTVLINSGDEQFASFTLQPFLQKSGINQIDWAIATDTQPDVSNGWNSLLSKSLAIKQFRDINLGVSSKNYQKLQQSLSNVNIPITSLKTGETLKINSQIEIQLLNQSPNIIKFTIGKLSWLLLSSFDSKTQQLIINQKDLLPKLSADILWWTGGSIDPKILQAINPKIAIASASSVVEEMVNRLDESKVRVFWTGRDGAIQWSPDKDFYTLRDQNDSRSPI